MSKQGTLKTIRIQKVPAAEWVLIRDAARRAGLTIVQYCRQVIRTAVDRDLPGQMR